MAHLPPGGHERRPRGSRAASALHCFVFPLPCKSSAFFNPCSHRRRAAATTLAAAKELWEMRPSPKPQPPIPHYLSQPLDPDLASARAECQKQNGPKLVLSSPPLPPKCPLQGRLLSFSTTNRIVLTMPGHATVRHPNCQIYNVCQTRCRGARTKEIEQGTEK